MKPRIKPRKKGTITRHRGYWCLRFREKVRVGDTIKTVQRSQRLAPVDAMHKTRKSVEGLARERRESIRKVPAQYVGIRLGDFVEGVYLPHAGSSGNQVPFVAISKCGRDTSSRAVQTS